MRTSAKALRTGSPPERDPDCQRAPHGTRAREPTPPTQHPSSRSASPQARPATHRPLPLPLPMPTQQFGHRCCFCANCRPRPVGSAHWRPKGVSMYAHVVRFTDVDPNHLAGRLDEVEASDGPPVDIPGQGHPDSPRPEPAHRGRNPVLRDGRRHVGSGGRTRRDGPGGHARDTRLDRPLQGGQGRRGTGVRRRRAAPCAWACQHRSVGCARSGRPACAAAFSLIEGRLSRGAVVLFVGCSRRGGAGGSFLFRRLGRRLYGSCLGFSIRFGAVRRPEKQRELAGTSVALLSGGGRA